MKKIGLVFIWMLSFSMVAFAQSPVDPYELRKPKLSDTDLLSRIENIEQNMVALQKQVYAEPKSNGGSINNATIAAQFDELYQSLKSIRGDIEQLQFETSSLNEKFIKFSSDVEFRLNELVQVKNQNTNDTDNNNKKINSIDKQLTQQNSSEGSDQKALEQKAKQVKTKDTGKKDQATISFQKAYSVMKEKDTNKALKMFQDFIDKNPNHSLVAEAYFWSGEINFQKGKYNQAAIKYLKGYQQNPKGNKAPDSLLKLGESLGKLYKYKEACLSFVKLKKEFPNPGSAIKKKTSEQMTNLGCK